ncbi:MAG: M16 family metallopeptidase [Yoonia sp.]|uniref:M16 family metallopeptidase n=1 Tax=Yoonia sp. TaxID=2212373 RepID=UPI003EF220A3
MLRIIFAFLIGLTATTAQAEIDIKEITSPGGIDAWVVEEPAIPFIAMEIRFRGGTSLDEPGKRGAVSLMTGLLEEGAGDMDAQDFQTAREALAASYGFRAFDDSLNISARFLTENQDEALELLRKLLVEPRFDQDAIDRVRAQVLSGIASDAKDPGTIASQAFDAAAFGDHPYGSPRAGTIESVTALTRDDIVAAHRNVLTRDRLYVSVVGDIRAEDVGPMLDNLLGALPAEGTPAPTDAGFALAGGMTVIDFDTPQAVALFGHEGMERDDPDFFAAFMANHILGGRGFGSRLMQEVREERGLTYGIGTSLVPMFHAEMIIGQVASANDTIAEAIAVTRAEWERIATEGVTAAELEKAKTYLTGAYPLRFDGNDEIAKIMVGMQMTGLTPDYVIDRNDFVEAVTLEQINRVASALFQPDNLHFVVVGQPVGLETQ